MSFEVAGIAVGREPILILGPCVIEDEEETLEIARQLKEMARERDLKVIFKASFDKANRTSLDAYRGPGLREGLRILRRVREEVGLPVTTDIHEPAQAEPAGEVVDLIQIPAFLCRQTDLLLAAGRTGKPVNVKKGQFLSPEAVPRIVEKVRSTGNARVLITERGTFFGYGDLVVDFRTIRRLSREGIPVILDITHSQQRPGARKSGGTREFALDFASAGLLMGAYGIFAETHPEPERAKSDADTQIPLEWVPGLMENVRLLWEIRGRLWRP